MSQPARQEPDQSGENIQASMRGAIVSRLVRFFVWSALDKNPGVFYRGRRERSGLPTQRGKCGWQSDDARTVTIAEDARAGMRTIRLPTERIKQKVLEKTRQKIWKQGSLGHVPFALKHRPLRFPEQDQTVCLANVPTMLRHKL